MIFEKEREAKRRKTFCMSFFFAFGLRLLPCFSCVSKIRVLFHDIFSPLSSTME